MPKSLSRLFRRVLIVYAGTVMALLFAAFVSEGISLGAAWRWAQFDKYPSVLAAIRWNLSQEAVSLYGVGLSNSVKSLAAYICLLITGGVALWRAVIKGRATWIFLVMLVFSIVPAAKSVSHLPERLFEWKHGSRYMDLLLSKRLEAFIENNKVGFKDAHGQTAIPALFTCVEVPSSVSAVPAIVVDINGKKTLIDYKGGELFPAIYDELPSLIFDRDWIRAKYKGKWGFIDYRGNERIPFSFEDLGEMGQITATKKLASFRQAGKWGYVNQAGKVVLPPVWDEAYAFYDGVASVRRSKKQCYIDQMGKELVPCEYDTAAATELGAPGLGLFWVGRDGKTGLYDSQLHRLTIPTEFGSQLTNSKVMRLPEGYRITPSKDDPRLKGAAVVFVATGQMPDIPWAQYKAELTQKLSQTASGPARLSRQAENEGRSPYCSSVR